MGVAFCFLSWRGSDIIMERPSVQDDATSLSTTIAPELPENSTEYMVFVGLDHTDRKKQLPELEKVRQSAVELSNRLNRDYIWQREEFSLELKCEDGKSASSLSIMKY